MKFVPLRRVARLVNGGTPTADAGNWGAEVAWATPVDLAAVDGGVLAGTQRSLTREGLRSGSASIPAESVLVSTRAPIGYLARTTAATAFNQGCRGIVPGPGVDVRYLVYALRFKSSALAAAGTGSTFQELASEALANTAIPLHSLPRQRRIADFLDDQVARLDAALKEVRSLARMAASQRASRLAEAYQDLPSPDFLEGRAATTVVSVRGLTLRLISGGTPATGDSSYWDDEGVPWIAIGDMVDGGTTQATQKALSPAGLAAARLRPAPPGTVLFAMYASVGKTTVTGMAAVWNQAVLGLVPRPGVDADFLLGWLELARPSLPAIARSATQDNLNADQVARLRVPRRTTVDQQRIGALRRAAVEHHARLLTAAAQTEQLVQERKRALITACVTGEFDVSTASTRAGDAAVAHLPPAHGGG
jgi:type I restriction enzyme S subunit